MLKPYMKLLHLDRIYRINRIFFCSIWLYPVHPVNPVRKIKLYFVKFFIRSDWPLSIPVQD